MNRLNRLVHRLLLGTHTLLLATKSGWQELPRDLQDKRFYVVAAAALAILMVFNPSGFASLFVGDIVGGALPLVKLASIQFVVCVLIAFVTDLRAIHLLQVGLPVLRQLFVATHYEIVNGWRSACLTAASVNTQCQFLISLLRRYRVQPFSAHLTDRWQAGYSPVLIYS